MEDAKMSLSAAAIPFDQQQHEFALGLPPLA